MSSILKNFSRLNLFLATVVLLGLGLRLWGINFGLPYTIAADETLYVTIALRMFITGDPNPHWLLYPSFWLYINALAYIPFFLIAKLAGVVAVPSDIPYPRVEALAVGLSQLPAQFILARGLAVLFSTATILAVYVVAYQVLRQRAGALLAALLFAVSPTSIANSKLYRPEAFATFFIVLSFAWSYKILAEPRLRNYIFAGTMAGLAVSCKYNAGVILLPMLVAHELCFGIVGWRRKEIYLGLAASALAFGLTTPFAMLDIPSLIDNLRISATVYSTGNGGVVGTGLAYYFQHLGETEGVLVLLAAAQSIVLLLRRSRTGLVLLAFPVVYFTFVGILAVHNARTILFVIPFLGILAAQFTSNFATWIVSQFHRVSWNSNSTFMLLAVLQVVPPLVTVVHDNIRITQIDGRDTARAWIQANLPPGSRIALESYSPFVDPWRFEVKGVGAIPDHPPSWYEENGFEYLIFSQGMYGRVFDDPTPKGVFFDRYNQFFSRLTEFKRFDDNSYEVRIYKTGAVLPPHRVAARFGNYGEVIELVGYDIVSGKWMPGEPLNIKLFWRTLADKSEPLAVALQLVDKNSHAVTSIHGDLFQGKGWQEGIFETDWTIPAKAGSMPGEYYLDVNVIQTQYSYSLPAKTWAGDDMGQVALGPFKLKVLPPLESELQSARQVNIQFGDKIALLSYTGIGSVHAGSSLPVILYWQALAKPTHDYTVFVHLLDADDKVVAQIDAEPRGGTYPTTVWDVGEIIRDDYLMKLPADLRPGTYRIELGLYEYPSLARLPVRDASGKVLGDHWALPDSIQVIR